MTIRPGDMTIVDMETTLFPRANLEHVGLGGMGSTYLFGPNDRRNADDARPAVYKSTGLQMFNGQGEWLWRPLHNPETLQISAFLDRNPRGFRPLAARPRLHRIPGRRPAFRAAPKSLGRADRRVGPGRPSSSSRSRPSPRSTTTSSPIGGPRLRCRPAARSPSPTGSSGAGRRPSARRSPRWRRRASEKDRADAAAVFSSTSRAIRWPIVDPEPSAPRSRRVRNPSGRQALALSGAQDIARGVRAGPRQRQRLRDAPRPGKRRKSPLAKHGSTVGRLDARPSSLRAAA